MFISGGVQEPRYVFSALLFDLSCQQWYILIGFISINHARLTTRTNIWTIHQYQ